MKSYILVGQTPVPCEDLLEWAKWFETTDRHVFQDTIGDHWVSTVFLGLDHRFFGDGPPILFETMVFCKHEGLECDLSNQMKRYATWLEAEAGHKETVKDVTLETEFKRINKLKWERP